MPYSNLSVTISESDLLAINNAIATLKQKLPFLITLTVEERRRLLKLGDKSVAFVDKALDAAKTHPGALPADFSIEEFEKDAKLVEQLTQIQSQLAGLLEAIDDTLTAAGSETMTHSVTVYSYLKTAVKRVPGLRPILDGLAERWKKLPAKEKPKPASVETP